MKKRQLNIVTMLFLAHQPNRENLYKCKLFSQHWERTKMCEASLLKQST